VAHEGQMKLQKRSEDGMCWRLVGDCKVEQHLSLNPELHDYQPPSHEPRYLSEYELVNRGSNTEGLCYINCNSRTFHLHYTRLEAFLSFRDHFIILLCYGFSQI
jgi:hypothetical protein